MPILILLLLSAACLPDARHISLFDWDLATRIYASSACVLTGWLAAISLSILTTFSNQSSPVLRNRTVHRYYLARRILFFFNLGLSVFAMFAVGWGVATEELFSIEYGDQRLLAPFAEILVSAPYLALAIGSWFLYYPAERSLHRSAAASKDKPFWSLPGFVFFQARQFAMFFLFPIGLNATYWTLLRFFPETANSMPYLIAMIAGFVVLIVLFPLFVKPLIGWKSMPTGPHRDQLEATGERLGFRRTDLLLWPTHGPLANALILGVVPRVRYVVFTDSILDMLAPAELDAVFGHEVGHARHGHLAYYMLFLLCSASAIPLVLSLAQTIVEGWGVLDEWQAVLWCFPVLGMGVYLFVVFGWLSRVCERQADIAGAKAASCGNLACEGHNEVTVLGNGRTLCPTGVRAMIQALEQVMGSHGLGWEEPTSFWKRWLAWFRSWQHGAPAVRIEFLQGLIERPELAIRHDRKAFRVRFLLILVLITLVIASGSMLGWSEVRKLM